MIIRNFNVVMVIIHIWYNKSNKITGLLHILTKKPLTRGARVSIALLLFFVLINQSHRLHNPVYGHLLD